MSSLIQIRRDTTTNWANVNPVLADGELGFDKTIGKFKCGDGTTAWNSLPYIFQYANQPSVGQALNNLTEIDFGSTPTDEASLVITGLTDITSNASIECFIQGDRTTSQNDASAHSAVAALSICTTTTIVPGTGFTAVVNLLSGLATGTFKLRYSYIP